MLESASSATDAAYSGSKDPVMLSFVVIPAVYTIIFRRAGATVKEAPDVDGRGRQGLIEAKKRAVVI